MIPMTHGQGPYFDESSRKYKCLCKTCHVKTGAWIIAIFGIVGVVYSLLTPPYVSLPVGREAYDLDYTHLDLYSVEVDPPKNANMNLTDMENNRYSYIKFGGHTIFSVIDAVVVGCLIAGLVMKQHHLLLPYLIVQLIRIMLIILLISLMLIAGAMYGDAILDFIIELAKQNKALNATAETLTILETMIKGVYAGVLIVMCICIFVDAWLFSIVRGCYYYFKDQTAWKEEGGTKMPSAVQYIVPEGEESLRV